MSDFSITRLGPITKTGDAAVQSSREKAGSKQRRQHPNPSQPPPSEEVDGSEEEKHDLDRLA